MTPTFEYRSVQQNFLDSYQASHTEQEFIASLETLLASKSVDQLLGGYQSTSPAGITKSLAENALFIDIFAQLASYYSHSGFSQAAATTGSLFVNYRDEPAGLFGDLISTHNSNLEATDIKPLLTPEQWLVLQHYFGLPESGQLNLANLAVVISRHLLAEKTGLHPKQVPLALDAALPITASVYANSLTTRLNTATSTTAQLLMVRALFSLAGWLRYIDFAEIAQQSLTALYDTNPDNPVLMLDVCLTSLRYQWRTEDAEQLPIILGALEQYTESAFYESCVTHLNDLLDIQNLAELGSITSIPDGAKLASARKAETDSLSHQMNSHYRGCVVIQGPEFLARQWLQAAGNQYQPQRRYYAIPSDTEISATSFNTDGDSQTFSDLDALLSYCHRRAD